MIHQPHTPTFTGILMVGFSLSSGSRKSIKYDGAADISLPLKAIYRHFYNHMPARHFFDLLIFPFRLYAFKRYLLFLEDCFCISFLSYAHFHW